MKIFKQKKIRKAKEKKKIRKATRKICQKIISKFALCLLQFLSLLFELLQNNVGVDESFLIFDSSKYLQNVWSKIDDIQRQLSQQKSTP